jgi:hypothetical protein
MGRNEDMTYFPADWHVYVRDVHVPLNIDALIVSYRYLAGNMAQTVKKDVGNQTARSKLRSFSWPCRSSDGSSLASLRGGPGSSTGQAMWDL